MAQLFLNVIAINRFSATIQLNMFCTQGLLAKLRQINYDFWFDIKSLVYHFHENNILLKTFMHQPITHSKQE